MPMTIDRVRDRAQILIRQLGKLTPKQRSEPIEKYAPLAAQLNLLIGWAKGLASDVEWPQPVHIQPDAGCGIPVVSGSIAGFEFAAQEILRLRSEVEASGRSVATAAEPTSPIEEKPAAP